jgi:hypothetical protein
MAFERHRTNEKKVNSWLKPCFIEVKGWSRITTLWCFCHFFTLHWLGSWAAVLTQKFTCVSSIMSLSMG